jgi:hypothetical protein
MYKRKILGILKYGTRGYAPTQKFQEGGFVAVSKPYDWREDPYEMMLLQQKAAQTNASIRAAGRKGGSSSSSANKKIDTFDRLKGGLPVTNAYINAKTAESQQEFYNKVRTSEEGWASSVEGQIAFKKVVNEGAALSEQAINEEKDFNDAFNKIETEDRKTLAISSNNGVMAQDGTGKVQRIQMATYLDNVDKFKVLTVDEFADWKKNADTGLQTNLTNEFLKENAVGANTMRKTYIDGKEDQIQYEFRSGHIVSKPNTGDAKGVDIVDLDMFKTGISNMMLGGSFYQGTSVQASSQNDFSTDVVNSIYADIMRSSASQSQLGASLAAEILSDGYHVAEIGKLKTSEEKLNYLEDRKKLLLVKKVVDKNNYGKSSSGAGAGAGTDEDVTSTHKAKASGLTADLNAIFDQKTAAQYTVGVENVNKKRTVSDVSLPMLRDGLTQANLDLVQDPKASVDQKAKANRFNRNIAIDTYSDNSQMYLPSGENMRSVLGNSAEIVKQFIAEDAVIAPNDTMPIVFMPVDAQGNIRTRDMLSLVPLKKDTRNKFLKSVKGKLPVPISTGADELLPGNTEAKKKADYQEYSNWLQKGADIKMYQQRSAANPQNQDMVNDFLMAQDAAAAIASASTRMKNITGDGITLQPMLGTWIIFDNDRHDIKANIETKVGNGFGKGMILEATPTEKTFLQDINGVDNSNYGMFNDHVYKMMIFTKIKSMGRAAAEGGDKLPAVAQMESIQQRMDDFMSTRSFISSPGNYDNVQLFLNQ